MGVLVTRGDAKLRDGSRYGCDRPGATVQGIEADIPGRACWSWWTFPAMLGVAADLASTARARTHLSPAHPRVYLGGFVELRLVANYGAVFGIGSGHETLVETAVAALLAVLLVVIACGRTHPAAAGLRWGWRSTGRRGRQPFGTPDRPRGTAAIPRRRRDLSFYPETFNLAGVAIRVGLLAAAVGWLVDRARLRAEPTTRYQACTQRGAVPLERVSPGSSR